MSDDDFIQAQQDRTQDTRPPFNELDLTFLTTQPAWGREAPENLRDKLEKIKGESFIGKDGRTYIPSEPLWDLLAFYTRDLRLGNLSNYNGEIEYCRYWLDMAGKCLRLGHVQSFVAALSRVITVCELSQSKGGFLRKRQGTITSEKIESSPEPKKNNLYGGRKK